ARSNTAGWLTNHEVITEFVPLFTVFCNIDRLWLSTYDQLHWQRVCKLEWSLATKRNNNASNLTTTRFSLDHIHYIFMCKRFEIETIAGVVVSRDCFGIAIDHHRFITGFTQCKACMHTAIVELNTLTNAIRTRTEDDHLWLCRWRHFVFVF